MGLWWSFIHQKQTTGTLKPEAMKTNSEIRNRPSRTWNWIREKRSEYDWLFYNEHEKFIKSLMLSWNNFREFVETRGSSVTKNLFDSADDDIGALSVATHDRFFFSPKRIEQIRNYLKTFSFPPTTTNPFLTLKPAVSVQRGWKGRICLP